MKRFNPAYDDALFTSEEEYSDLVIESFEQKKSNSELVFVSVITKRMKDEGLLSHENKVGDIFERIYIIKNPPSAWVSQHTILSKFFSSCTFSSKKSHRVAIFVNRYPPTTKHILGLFA
ncbi:MAG: hypothetical protein ACK5JS_08385 [Mangrovibacterium sp.]